MGYLLGFKQLFARKVALLQIILMSLVFGFAIMPSSHAQITDPAQIKPILEMTQANWVAVREWQGEDLLYFTHLEAWRCGIASVHYGLNGEAAEATYALDECFTDRANPNEIDAENHLPYLTFELKSVDQVSIKIELKDGSILQASYERGQIQIP